MRWLHLFLPLLAFLAGPFGRAAEVIPPKPRDHFNDYAGIVRRDDAVKLNDELAQFERDTSNQIVVAIFPKMQSSSSIEDYTVRVAQAWAVGQRDKKNGAVLFIFQQDRKLYVQVGYGLEGVLPDARCKQIIENEITPRFRAGDFTGGAAAGTRALMAAVKGEYRGTGRTAREARRDPVTPGDMFYVLVGTVVMGGFFLWLLRKLWHAIFGAPRPRRRAILYDGRGRTVWTSAATWLSSSGSGGSGGGGGGSFSSGGGSFGGGGAGGSW